MNDNLNFIDERQKRRYEKVLQKTGEEYLQEIAILKSREDFLEEYEYFLQLLDSPFSDASGKTIGRSILYSGSFRNF